MVLGRFKMEIVRVARVFQPIGQVASIYISGKSLATLTFMLKPKENGN